jgi:hypothetical protein
LLCIYYVDTCYDAGVGGDDYCYRDNAGDDYGGGCGVSGFARGSVTVSVMVMVTIAVLVITVRKEMVIVMVMVTIIVMMTMGQ